MPMSGVRCNVCAALGQEVWVIAGRHCSHCSTPCDGSRDMVQPAIKSSTPEGLHYRGDLVFTYQDHNTPGLLTLPASYLVNETWEVFPQRPDELVVSETNSIAHSEINHRLVKVLVRVNNNAQCWTSQDLADLSLWNISSEWLETTSSCQSLQVSYCRKKLWNQKPYLHLLIRDIQDSEISTIVSSYEINEHSTCNGFWTTHLPRTCSTTRLQEAKQSILSIRQRLQTTTEHLKHPILLPTLFLESKIQEMEQSCADGFSPATYRAISWLTNTIDQHPQPKTFAETQQDIKITTEGLYDGHQSLSIRRYRITKLKSILRAISQGLTILDTVGCNDSSLSQSSECIRDRVDFLEERLRVVETTIETSRSEFNDLSNMLQNAINQQDSRLNHSIARDSKQIAAAALRDSSAMKSIALLTIVFLPGTFIAALFSTGLFKFAEPSPHGFVSEDFWFYWVVTLPTTGLVLLIWLMWLKFIHREEDSVAGVNREVLETSGFGTMRGELLHQKVL